MKTWIGLLALLTSAACAREFTEPVFAGSTGEITLRLGQQVRLGARGPILAFRAVPEDSRCPASVVCVWSGDALVQMEATADRQRWQPLELHTHVEPRSVSFAGYIFELDALSPYPLTERAIPQDEYSAVLKVRRAD